MSTAPLARDEDLRRLLDDGYDVTLDGGHLVVRRIPYVTADEAVAYGSLAYPVTVSGDQMVSDTDHRIWFVGDSAVQRARAAAQLRQPRGPRRGRRH